MNSIVNIARRQASSGGGAAPNPDFVSTWDTTKAGSASDTIVLPMTAGNTVHWGDGNSDTTNTHTYASSGTYTVTIEGTVNTFRFANSGDKAKITDVSNWGTFDIAGDSVFYGCANLEFSATDAPLISTTSLYRGLRGCTSLNSSISNWDVSGVTNTSQMFYDCNTYNESLNGLDVSNVTNTSQMFKNCTAFNGAINLWDVGSVVVIYEMFINCSSFNQSLNDWDVTSALDMRLMFSNCTSFDQPLNNWDVSGATEMNGLFINCISFNQSLNNWDVSGVGSMNQMFRGCTSFNSTLGTWTSTPSDVRQMFRGATIFNQPLTGLDTSSCTDMYQMFWNTAFDQDISFWDINQVSNFLNFMQGVTLSTANYDALLIAWDAQGAMSFSGTVNFGGSQYTAGGAAETARTSLISKWGGITDGGGI